jgi:hypothetical protein
MGIIVIVAKIIVETKVGTRGSARLLPGWMAR